MLKFPHFGHTPEVNAHIKLLLTRVHGGYLYLHDKISLDTDLIWWITQLSMKGEDPVEAMTGKKGGKKLSVKMLAKFGLTRASKCYDVSQIRIQLVRFATQLLTGRILR